MSAARDALKLKLSEVLPVLNEKQRRILVAAEARAYGHGGVQTLSEITGLCRQTIYRGFKDLESKIDTERIRRRGGGRKKLRDKHPKLIKTLESLIEPVTRGDPESPLRWTCKSVRNLEKSLRKSGFDVSYRTVANILSE